MDRGGGAYPTHQQRDRDWPFDYPPNSHVIRVVPAAVKSEKGSVRRARGRYSGNMSESSVPSVIVDQSGQHPKYEDG